ncbi:MAG: hypothetical protein OHK0038_22320 [Flammeovirgaceae bacterium]
MVELMIITAMLENKRPSDKNNDGVKVLIQETAQKVILFLTGTTIS